MISIIICSRDEEMLRAITQNVADTIGIAHEIVPIFNKTGQYSIFQAYNIGISRSRYDVLCFMHEDIFFETTDWGNSVLKAFSFNPNLGLLGVAGSSYKALVPSGWSFWSALNETFKINVIQHYKSGKPAVHVYNNPDGRTISKAATVDGLWFCTPRVLAEKIKFDELNFKGFHCYDIDYSLSVLQTHDVAVTFEVLINHFSEGSADDSWLEETLKLHEKWKDILPVSLDDLTIDEQRQQEYNAFHEVIYKLPGKKMICLKFMKSIFKRKMVSLFGIQQFLVLESVIIKKLFENRK